MNQSGKMSGNKTFFIFFGIYITVHIIYYVSFEFIDPNSTTPYYARIDGWYLSTLFLPLISLLIFLSLKTPKFIKILGVAIIIISSFLNYLFCQLIGGLMA